MTWPDNEQRDESESLLSSACYGIGRGTVHGYDTTDSEQIPLAARDAIHSTIQGALEIDADVYEAIRGTSQGFFEGAAEQSGNLLIAMRSLLSETSREAIELELGSRQALFSAIKGVLETRCDIDEITASEIGNYIRQTTANCMSSAKAGKR